MRRRLKIAGIALGALALLVVTLLLAVLVGGNTDRGRAAIERLTQRLTGGHVTLIGLAGSFPSSLSLRELRLSDAEGVWLDAEQIAVQWHPLALLWDEVRVDTLVAARVAVERLPVKSGKSSGTISLPTIAIGHFASDRLELGSPLAGVRTTLAVQGGGVLRSLEEAQADVVAQRVGGDGDYRVQFRFDTRRMDATLHLVEPASGPLENLLGLPGLGALAANATLSGPHGAERLAVAIDAGALQARVRGTLNLTRRTAELDFNLKAPALQPRPDLGWAGIDVHGRWQGAFTAPTADAQLSAQKLELPGAVKIGDLGVVVKASGGAVDAQGTIAQLNLPGTAVDLLAADPIQVSANLRLDDPTRPLKLRAASRLFSLDATARTLGKQTADLTVRLTDLAPWAALLGERVTGSATLESRLTRESAGLATQLKVNASLSSAPAAWRLLGSSVDLELGGTFGERRLIIDAARLHASALEAGFAGAAERDANGRITALQGHYQFSVADLARAQPALGGNLEASGDLTGAPGSLGIDAHWSTTLSVHGSAPGRLHGDLVARGLPGAPTGSLHAEGALDGAPLALGIDVARDPTGTLRVLVKNGAWKSVQIAGAVSVGATLAGARGRLALHIAQLGDFSHLLGSDLAGSVEGGIEFDAAQPPPAEAHAARGARSSPAGASSSAHAVHHSPATAHANFHLDAADVTIGQFAGGVHLRGTGDLDAVALQLGIEVPVCGGESCRLDATALLNLRADTLRLDTAKATVRGLPVHLAAPATLSFANGITVDHAQIEAQQAVLTVAGRLSPQLEVRATLSDVRPALVNLFQPDLLAGGTLSGHAELTGRLAAPFGAVHVDALGIRFAGNAATALPSLDVKAAAQLQGDSAQLDAVASAGADSRVTVTGGVPLDLKGAYGLKVGGKLDVGLLGPLLEARGLHAAGQIDIDAAVTGPATAADIAGTVHLNKGSLRDYTRGLDLTQVKATLTGSNGALKVDSFTAKAESGTIAMSGTVGLLEAKIPVDLRITAKNAQPLTSALLTANLDADVHVQGTARERLDVSGTINVSRAKIGIPSSLPPDVAVLDVRRRGQKTAPPRVQPLVIGLQLAINAPRQVLVEGRGLDAELGGALKIGGTAAAPEVGGDLELQRGSLSIAGGTLAFQSGRVSFDGADPKNRLDPTLNFSAQASLTAPAVATAYLDITGLATAPVFDFHSDPTLPQDEILSGLLFGVPASSLSAVQLAQIGAALAIMSGVGGDGSYNPIAYLQKTFGLDRLTVQSDTTTTATGTPTSSGYSVAAGRYLSKRVYVQAKQSTTGASQVQVDVDLNKHLKLLTRLGNGTAITQGTTPENDPGSSVGLSYTIEY
jgi:translocation and assembly module TamB